jgi:hypothetical protein
MKKEWERETVRTLIRVAKQSLFEPLIRKGKKGKLL